MEKYQTEGKEGALEKIRIAALPWCRGSWSGTERWWGNCGLRTQIENSENFQVVLHDMRNKDNMAVWCAALLYIFPGLIYFSFIVCKTLSYICTIKCYTSFIFCIFFLSYVWCRLRGQMTVVNITESGIDTDGIFGNNHKHAPRWGKQRQNNYSITYCSKTT